MAKVLLKKSYTRTTSGVKWVPMVYRPYEAAGRWRWSYDSSRSENWEYTSWKEEAPEGSATHSGLLQSTPLTDEELIALDMVADGEYDLVATIPGLFVADE